MKVMMMENDSVVVKNEPGDVNKKFTRRCSYIRDSPIPVENKWLYEERERCFGPFITTSHLIITYERDENSRYIPSTMERRVMYG